MPIKLGNRMATFAALFNQAPAVALGAEIPDQVIGTVDLTQFLLTRPAVTKFSAVGLTMTANGVFVAGLTVPVGKGWAVLGFTVQTSSPAATVANFAAAISDAGNAMFLVGPPGQYDPNATPATNYVLQPPVLPWPILLAPGNKIGGVMLWGSPGPFSLSVVARVVEVDLYG